MTSGPPSVFPVLSRYGLPAAAWIACLTTGLLLFYAHLARRGMTTLEWRAQFRKRPRKRSAETGAAHRREKQD